MNGGVETLRVLEAEMREGLRAAMDDEGEWLRTADLRYAGQNWDIEVDDPQEGLRQARIHTGSMTG